MAEKISRRTETGRKEERIDEALRSAERGGGATEPKKYLASGTFSSGRKKPTILPRCSVGWPGYFDRSMVCVAPVALSWARGLGLGIYAHLINPPRESVDPAIAIDGSNTYGTGVSIRTLLAAGLEVGLGGGVILLFF